MHNCDGILDSIYICLNKKDYKVVIFAKYANHVRNIREYIDKFIDTYQINTSIRCRMHHGARAYYEFNNGSSINVVVGKTNKHRGMNANTLIFYGLCSIEAYDMGLTHYALPYEHDCEYNIRFINRE